MRSSLRRKRRWLWRYLLPAALVAAGCGQWGLYLANGTLPALLPPRIYTGLAVDGEGYCYVVDNWAGTVWRVPPPARLSHPKPRRVPGTRFQDEVDTSVVYMVVSRWHETPSDVVILSKGRVCASETLGGSVRVFDPRGLATTALDPATDGYAVFAPWVRVACGPSGDLVAVLAAESWPVPIPPKGCPASTVPRVPGAPWVLRLEPGVKPRLVAAGWDGPPGSAPFVTIGPGLAGKGGAFGPDNGVQALAVGPDGSPYLAGPAAVWKIDLRARAVVRVAGTGTPGFGGDGGPAVRAKLDGVRGLTCDARGNLYIVDGKNARLRRVGPTGIIQTIAGRGRNAHSGDGGPARGACLHDPMSAAVGPAGALYVSEGDSGTIRKIDRWGTITTVARPQRPSVFHWWP